jgi:hypothetical protein
MRQAQKHKLFRIFGAEAGLTGDSCSILRCRHITQTRIRKEAPVLPQLPEVRITNNEKGRGFPGPNSQPTTLNAGP